MTTINTIYINPLLRNLIASGYEMFFGISRKRALGVVLAFVDPRMDSASSFNKRGVLMSRERPWFPIIKEKEEYGTVITKHDLDAYTRLSKNAAVG